MPRISLKKKSCRNNASKKMLTMINTKIDLVQETLNTLVNKEAGAPLSDIQSHVVVGDESLNQSEATEQSEIIGQSEAADQSLNQSTTPNFDENADVSTSNGFTTETASSSNEENAPSNEAVAGSEITTLSSQESANTMTSDMGANSSNEENAPSNEAVKGSENATLSSQESASPSGSMTSDMGASPSTTTPSENDMSSSPVQYAQLESWHPKYRGPTSGGKRRYRTNKRQRKNNRNKSKNRR